MKTNRLRQYLIDYNDQRQQRQQRQITRQNIAKLAAMSLQERLQIIEELRRKCQNGGRNPRRKLGWYGQDIGEF